MWGPQRIFDPRTHKLRPVPRTPVIVVAGPPIDLSKWEGAAATGATLGEITEHLMLVLRDMVAELRGGTPPPLWQPVLKPSTLDSSATSAPSSTSEV
jgi:hypothetical protein